MVKVPPMQYELNPVYVRAVFSSPKISMGETTQETAQETTQEIILGPRSADHRRAG